MKILKSIFISAKLLIVSALFVVALVASQTDVLNLTKAWFTSSLTATANLIETGVWTPTAPINQGWNLSTNPGGENGTPLDLVCAGPNPEDSVITNGGNPLAPRVAHNWSAVTGTNIIYQREVTYPSGTQTSYFYPEPSTNNYTRFSSFGSPLGTEGLWGTRVRAIEDVDNSGDYTAGDFVSAWSNKCYITLDTSAPTIAFTQMPLDSKASIYKTKESNFYTIKGVIKDEHNNTYRLQIFKLDDPKKISIKKVSIEPDKDTVDTGDIKITGIASAEISYDWNIKGADGWYSVELSAKDSAGNTNQIKTKVQVTNPTPPSSTITITNSPEKEVVNKIKNGGFENDLTDWQVAGSATIINQQQENIFASSQSLQLGSFDSQNLLVDNSITQIIDNSGKGLRSIGFWYKIQTQETALGFDEPAFMVYVNDQMRYWISAKSWNEQSKLENNGWRYASVYVADLDDEQIKLSFYAGSHGDAQQSSIVYLDQITTDATVVNKDALFTIYTDEPNNQDAQVVYEYKVGGKIISETGSSGLQFKLAGQPDNQELYYWTKNIAGVESAKNRIEVILDQELPTQIADLAAYNEGDDEYSLTFTAPADNIFMAVREYDIRYSTEEITAQTNWEDLPKVQLIADDQLPGQVRAPKTAGQIEDLIAMGLDIEQIYYFAIKAVDTAGNISTISNIATPKVNQFGENYTTSPVVINEIAYNLIGSDSGNWQDGEWVELYNRGDQDINLAGWHIVDEAGKQLFITQENSDNNLILADGGETIIPAKSWLTVYRNGNRFLNNDGDSVSLYNSADSLVDSYVYQGNVQEGYTEARETDGLDRWSFKSIATPGRANAVDITQLNPVARLYKQADNELSLVIFDSNNYDTAEYYLTYTHLLDETEIDEALTGKLNIDSQQIQTELFLGTCSTEGACNPHNEIQAQTIELTLVLKGGNLPDRTIEISLTGEW